MSAPNYDPVEEIFHGVIFCCRFPVTVCFANFSLILIFHS